MEKPLLMLVDDNEDILFNLKLLLEVNEYEVVTAKSGKEALSILSSLENIPAVIISDIMMPNMNGYEFFATVSANPQLNRVPFLFLTAKSTSEDIRLGKMLGVDDYITKPFKKEDLLASISGKLIRNRNINLIDNKLNEMLTSLNIEMQPSILKEEHGKFCLMLVFWDDIMGPSLKVSYPPDNDCTFSISTISKQLFHAATSIYGHDKITKAEGILLNIENIKKKGYLFFDSFPDKSERYGEKQYMLSVIAPNLTYFDSLRIKEVLKEISENIKAKHDWDIKKFWERIFNILEEDLVILPSQ